METVVFISFATIDKNVSTAQSGNSSWFEFQIVLRLINVFDGESQSLCLRLLSLTSLDDDDDDDEEENSNSSKRIREQEK